MVQDILSDFIARLKNGSQKQKSIISIFKTKICFNILVLLYKEGYINGFKIQEKQKLIIVYLKYINNKPVFQDIKRISTPSKPIFTRVKHLNKIAHAVVTTSKGLMFTKDAKFFKIGGKVLFKII